MSDKTQVFIQNAQIEKKKPIIDKKNLKVLSQKKINH